MNMSRKGISPLIAAVLLIAFTMAVASLFAQWAPQLIKSAQGDTKNQSEQIQKCSGAIVSFQSANTSQVTLQQTSGNNAVGNVSVTWFYSDGTTPKQAYADIGSTRGFDTVTTGSYGSGLDEIRAQPLECQGAPTATYTP